MIPFNDFAYSDTHLIITGNEILVAPISSFYSLMSLTLIGFNCLILPDGTFLVTTATDLLDFSIADHNIWQQTFNFDINTSPNFRTF